MAPEKALKHCWRSSSLSRDLGAVMPVYASRAEQARLQPRDAFLYLN